jgi:pyruvate/2-oxoglutarate dehydrogenase complex dihydrolipoamide acyltransferase (E2) component
MRRIYSFLIVALAAVGLMALPAVAGTAYADDCGTIAARIAAHNAQPHVFTQQQMAQYNAYNAEAAALEAEKARCLGQVRNPAPPPRQQQPAPPRPPQQRPQINPNQRPAQPKPSNPAPRNQQPARPSDPGLRPLQNGSATGYQGRLGKPDVKPAGSPRDTIKVDPPGWNDIPANLRSNYARGHLRPDVLKGSPEDPRNFVVLTREANTRMSVWEKKIAGQIRSNPDPNYWVDYQVTPRYGNGYGRPPTDIRISAIDKNGQQLIPRDQQIITNYKGPWPPK